MERGSTVLIVLVDDDPGMRVSMRFLLEACGYEVAAYADPADMFADFDAAAPACAIPACAIPAGAIPACAIIDIHLADADGLAVGRALRGVRRDLPMIFVTGRADARIRADAVELGAVAVLEKPFSAAALLDAVRLGLDGAARGLLLGAR